MSSLEIKFQTNQLTPAPYSHAIEFRVDFKDKSTFVAMDITYLDRDTLSVDEITDEGFTENDNIILKSILPKIWETTLQETVAKTTFTKKEELNEAEEFIQINGRFPSQSQLWVQLLQELRQAVIEKAEKEAPLYIGIMRNDNSKSQEYAFEASFVTREFIRTHAGKKENFNWSDLNTFLRDVYAGEFLYDKSHGKHPKKDGIHIHIGDEYWLELGKSYLIQPSKITRWLK